MNISEISGFSVNDFNLLRERLVFLSHGVAAVPVPEFNAFYFILFVCVVYHICACPQRGRESWEQT